jgi:hypothetical protein
MQRRAFFISRKGFSTDGNHYQRLRFPMECSRLYLNGKIIARIIADETYPKMWRVVRPDGSLSDMASVSSVRFFAIGPR